MTAPSIKEALEAFVKAYGAQDSHTKGLDDASAMAKAALATLSPPAGERREAIARKLAEKWPGDYMHGDDEDQREPNALAYETADVLASGLVQDEAAIRKDERVKCAKIAGSCHGVDEGDLPSDVRAGERIASAIRSPRDGGAES